MFFNRFSAAIILLSGSASAAPTVLIQEAWQGFSSPDIISAGFTHNLFALPLEGATQWQGPRNWSSDYWASREGGINRRWNSPRQQGFNYSSPSASEIRRLSRRQMMALSPTEKFDILNGRYDYPLKKKVASEVSPRADKWEGICHGWVVATTHHNEPTPKTLRNADGIEIPFGTADIKALLSYYYAIDQGPAANVGLRCNFGNWTGGPKECDQDLNAGAFHIILANKLALRHEGLIMDVDRLKEVWNQPVIGYRSQVIGRTRPSRQAAATAVIEYRIATEIYYVEETEPTWNVVHGTQNQKMAKKNFVYRVELNNRDEIVGGTWESTDRPDFLWQKPKAVQFGGQFSMLSRLLNDSGAPVVNRPRAETSTTTTTTFDTRDYRRSDRRPDRTHTRNYYDPRTGAYVNETVEEYDPYIEYYNYEEEE